MTDLARFVKRLVEVLEARDPAGVHRPLSVADLRGTIFPYRTQRSSLGLTSAEDYDLLVLRLVSEEDDFVRTYPPESAAQARDEAGAVNPNLDLVEDLGDATIQIGATALARIQAMVEELSPQALEFLEVIDVPRPAVEPGLTVEAAPPSAPAPIMTAPANLAEPELPAFEPIAETIDIAIEPTLPPVTPVEAAPPLVPIAPPAPATPTCRACHATLPERRAVMFCPFCGERQGPAACARCGTELEPGWCHCVECGQAVPGAERPR